MMTSVLISGAGIAGPTLAYWLAEHGFAVTVVERARGSRSSGSPVDVRGAAMEVAAKMGILPQLRQAATQARTLSFLNVEGNRAGSINLGLNEAQVELPRGDLASILYGASRDRAEYLFGDSIVELAQDSAGADVVFESGARRRFGLVIGADGLHSAVRRLAFGPEQEFIKHMGIYVATMPLGEAAADERDVVMYNTPGKAVTIHPSRGKALAAFMFRSPAIPGFDYRDVEQHKKLLVEAFAGTGWRVPELLGRVRTADDLFFDSVSQVVLPKWSAGRVSLLGDAASCVSLFGDGSSLAMAGAVTLAGALATGPSPESGLAQYERIHRKLVNPKQRNVSRASRLLIPATGYGLSLRNFATRLLPQRAA